MLSFPARDTLPTPSDAPPRPSDVIAELAPGLREVVALALAGLTNGEIAARRGTSPATVAKQLDAAYRALGVRGRRELAALVARE